MEHLTTDFGENWFTYPNLYKTMVANCRPNGSLVELGAWKGRSSAFLIVEAFNKSPDIKVHIVDTWLGSGKYTEGIDVGVYEVFLSNLSPLNGLYTPHRMKTDDAVHLFEDGSLDGVFIDADHEYDAVRRDIENWLPKVRKGGILAGHDYHETWPGVIKAVNEFFNDFTVTEQSWLRYC